MTFGFNFLKQTFYYNWREKLKETWNYSSLIFSNSYIKLITCSGRMRRTNYSLIHSSQNVNHFLLILKDDNSDTVKRPG